MYGFEIDASWYDINNILENEWDLKLVSEEESIQIL